MNRGARILIFAPDVRGGLAEHVYHQARALARAGADVRCLVGPSFLPGRSLGVPAEAVLADPPQAGLGRASRRLRQFRWLVFNRWRLASEIRRHRPDLVLLDSFVEYLSPLWIWPHWFLARFRGVRYAANLHDPVRNYQMGPRWWHRLSIWLAYLPLDFVLVHHPLPVPSPVPGRVRAVQVPVGVYEVGGARGTREEWRRRNGVGPGQKVFLAFGYVRDGKNLHLIIQALAGQPEAIFVMAGSTQAASDRGFSHYKELAARLGVLDRCRFFEGFVPDEEVAALFEAADFIVLTYSAEFHSQSGVLNVAARCRKPVLVSSGPGPLGDAVRRFNLGVAVEPDSLQAIESGMARILAQPPTPSWTEYEAFASWDANAEGILRGAGFLASE